MSSSVETRGSDARGGRGGRHNGRSPDMARIVRRETRSTRAGVAIVFGASAWLLLAATLIALLQSFGLSWLQALLITSLLSLAVTGYAIWRVSYFFHHTGMHATRRQLSRLGLFDEPTDDDPDAGVQIPEGKP